MIYAIWRTLYDPLFDKIYFQYRPFDEWVTYGEMAVETLKRSHKTLLMVQMTLMKTYGPKEVYYRVERVNEESQRTAKARPNASRSLRAITRGSSS